MLLVEMSGYIHGLNVNFTHTHKSGIECRPELLFMALMFQIQSWRQLYLIWGDQETFCGNVDLEISIRHAFIYTG